VLRTDVEGHALGLELDVDARVGGLAGDVGQLLAIGERSSTLPSSLASASSSPGIGSTSTMPATA
jgi:hypothetical protein